MEHAELYSMLTDAVTINGTAIRLITRLQPAGGVGDKVFPPTYPTDNNKVVYATETRLINGQPVDCVLLDSVQSQANRLELVLQEAIDAGTLNVPLIETDIAGYGRLTILQAPHRLYNALLRDSEIDGVRFWNTALGQKLMAARPGTATVLYQHCPQMMLFGGWHSFAESGGRGAKIPRALTSEIVGIKVMDGIRPASRIDPTGIATEAGRIFKAQDPTRQWTLDESQAEQAGGKPVEYGNKEKKGKPSAIGHGNVKPSLEPGGVTLTEALQTAVLSMPALRRLRFPDDAGCYSSERDQAGRIVLAALGLCALSLQIEQGFDLRSRCLLVPVDLPRFEVVGRTLAITQSWPLDFATARAVFQQAVDNAAQQSLHFAETVKLQASAELNELVGRSHSTPEATA